MKYSVLMSVYAKEKAEYLDLSIKSMLNQTIKPDEFIIVKDGKLTNELEDLINNYCREFPQLFTILSNKQNVGLGISLSKGVLASRNNLIARMDSDDYSSPNRCEKEINCFIKDPSLDVVGTFEAEFQEDIQNVLSIHSVPETNKQIKQFMKRRCAILHPTVMYKKSSVLKVGNYRDIPLYEDYDLFARMLLEHNLKAYNIQDNLYYIRINDDFFKRRGGIKYALTSLNFKWHMYRRSLIGFFDFVVSGFGQFIICVLPNHIRKIFYKYF